MEWMLEIFRHFGDWMRPYADEIAFSQMATLLVVYGERLNRAVRKSLSDLHFLLRFAVYVLICAFGYGALSVGVGRVGADFYRSIQVEWLPFVVLAIFALIAHLAQKARHV